MQTAVFPIVADKRVPFDDFVPYIGVDYSTAAFSMEVRNEEGDQGDPLFSLGMSVSGGQGVVATFDEAYGDPETGGPVEATIIRLIINETTLEGLDYNGDPSAPLNLRYDVHCTPAGGKKFVIFAGKFLISPGVTL